MKNTEKLLSIHVDQIKVVEGRNPRLTLTGIEELAESILENGVCTPIKVQLLPTAGKATTLYQLVDGHRRVAACQWVADHKQVNITIPAMVVSCKDESEALLQMLVANDSEPFSPFEEALMFQRLKQEFNWTLEQLSQRCGRSISHVADKLALLRADPVVQEAVKTGELTVTDANTIIRKSKGDKETQRAVTQRVLEEGREEVIEKELKKGRMPKVAWEVASVTYDQLWEAALPYGGLKELVQVVDLLPHLAQLPVPEQVPVEDELNLSFYLGKMMAFAEVSNLTLPELVEKLEQRNNT